MINGINYALRTLLPHAEQRDNTMSVKTGARYHPYGNRYDPKKRLTQMSAETVAVQGEAKLHRSTLRSSPDIGKSQSEEKYNPLKINTDYRPACISSDKQLETAEVSRKFHSAFPSGTCMHGALFTLATKTGLTWTSRSLDAFIEIIKSYDQKVDPLESSELGISGATCIDTSIFAPLIDSLQLQAVTVFPYWSGASLEEAFRPSPSVWNLWNDRPVDDGWYLVYGRTEKCMHASCVYLKDGEISLASVASNAFNVGDVYRATYFSSSNPKKAYLDDDFRVHRMYKFDPELVKNNLA